MADGNDNEGRLVSWQNWPTHASATVSGTTTTTSYLGRLEEVDTTGATTTTTAYYGALAERVNGALSYTLADGLGSVSETATPSATGLTGPTLVTQLYGPYGRVRYTSGTLPTDKGYTGQRADALTGLDDSAWLRVGGASGARRRRGGAFCRRLDGMASFGRPISSAEVTGGCALARSMRWPPELDGGVCEWWSAGSVAGCSSRSTPRD